MVNLVSSDGGAAADEGGWPPPETWQIASCTDIVSNVEYELWYRSRRPDETRGFLKRRIPTSFLVVKRGTSTPVAVLHTLSEVVAWHDGNVISPGWRLLDRRPEEWAELGLPNAGQALAGPD